MGRTGRPAAAGAAPPQPTLASPPDDAVEVGRVAGAWGVRGAIRVHPFAADPQALLTCAEWWLRPPEGASARPVAPDAAPLPPRLHVRQARMQGDAVVALCDGVDDRDAAQALKGARVFVPRSGFPAPAADEYYWVDLIGSTVVNRQGVSLGTVSGLLQTGPQCVLCVVPQPVDGSATSAGREPPETLIPFVAAYVDAVDTVARVIRVDWEPEAAP